MTSKLSIKVLGLQQSAVAIFFAANPQLVNNSLLLSAKERWSLQQGEQNLEQGANYTTLYGYRNLRQNFSDSKQLSPSRAQRRWDFSAEKALKCEATSFTEQTDQVSAPQVISINRSAPQRKP